jgi:NADH-quinone oxidoreductase subunit J
MNLVFLLAGTIALGSALMMVTRRNPVYAAVWLLGTFLSIAVTFLTLHATFLAFIHILVYTGAILVLFLFVIMLLNLKNEEFGEEYPLPVRLSVGGMCASMFLVLSFPILREPALWQPTTTTAAELDRLGSVEAVGNVMFRSYALQFELVSVLIIVAMFGAMVIAKKRIPG